MNRATAALLFAGGLSVAACGTAVAQQNAAANWPSKPIHAVVPLAPGTGGDVMARLMLNQLAQQLGQAIAVSSPQRAAALPDVPTTLEAGYANSDYVIWVGLFLPAKTPRPIVEKLNLEMKKAWQNPALRERFTGLDVTPMLMTPAEFDALIKKEIADNAALAKAAGLQPN